jgi:hypothetical protein
MAKSVLFAGAGCSKTLGFPVVSEILPLIIEGINKRELFKNIADTANRTIYTNLLKDLIEKVCPGMHNIFKNPASGKLPLITDILSQAEFFLDYKQDIIDWNNAGIVDIERGSRLYERLTLRDITALLNSAIIEVIQKTDIENKGELEGMIKWIKDRNTIKSVSEGVSIITTNYDYSLEWNILEGRDESRAAQLFDYGFSWRDTGTTSIHQRPLAAPYRIFKLHGSVDWLKCPRCGFIYINPTNDIHAIPLSNRKTNATKCDCGYWPLETVLVAPSYIREYRESNILQVWQLALEELRTAEEWLIAGFSMPTEDFGIRSLFLRALHGRKEWPAITVIQHNDDCKPKYETFFGADKFRYENCSIEHFDFNKVRT